MKEPDISKEKTFVDYTAKRRDWVMKTASDVEQRLGVGADRKVTAHDLLKAYIGPRQSLNVEDRRSHKEKGKLYRLDIETGEELPEIEYDMKPIGIPDPSGNVGEEEFNKILQGLSDDYQQSLKPKRGEDWRKFKEMGRRTLWNIADKLEKAGW